MHDVLLFNKLLHFLDSTESVDTADVTQTNILVVVVFYSTI